MGTNYGDSRGRVKFNVSEWEAFASVYGRIIRRALEAFPNVRFTLTPGLSLDAVCWPQRAISGYVGGDIA